MDLLGASNFVLCFEDQVCPVAVQSVSPDGAIRFAPLQVCREVSSSGIQVKASLHFSIASQRFVCHGEMYSPEPHQFVFVRKSEVVQERRSEPRYELPGIPASITESAGLHKHRVPAAVRDISRNGVQFQTTTTLLTDRRYLIHIELPGSSGREMLLLRQRILSVEAYLDIRHWRRERDINIYGGQIFPASAEDRVRLDEFISGIERTKPALPR